MEPAKSIVLFDGVCNLCNASVQFLIRHDKKDQLRFAPLQSETAKNLLQGSVVNQKALDSVVLVEAGEVYVRSTSALRLARILGFPTSLLYGFIILPRPFRDWLYDLIARYRYRMFGRREECMMPTPELRRKFL